MMMRSVGKWTDGAVDQRHVDEGRVGLSWIYRLDSASNATRCIQHRSSGVAFSASLWLGHPRGTKIIAVGVLVAT